MLVRFCFLLVALSGVVHAQTATVETISADFTARFISPDGSAIGGTSTDHTAVESVIGTFHYYHHYPAVWVDGQVHRLHLPDLYTPNEVYEEVRTDVVAVTANAEIIYGNARQTGAEPGGNPARPGVVRWDGVGGAMTFLEGLPESSTMYAASRDGLVVIGSLPRISTDPFGVFRWEDGSYVELDGIDSQTHYVSPWGVNDEGRVFGTRQSMSAPYHTDVIWWDVDGRLTIGPDLGPESVAGVSGDGESMIVNAQLNVRQTDVVSPGKILRGEEVVETGGAIFAPTGGITHSGGSDSPPGSQVSYDGSMMYTRVVEPNSPYSSQLWVEGIGAAPIHDVLAERYGVVLPACPTSLGAGVAGVLSSDGRVLTVKCSESPSPERDQLTYRVALPSTARWADATDGFFDTASRWAPARVPDSLVAVRFDAAGSRHTVSFRRDESASSMTVSAPSGSTGERPVTFALGNHTLRLGPSVSSLVVGDSEDGFLQLDGGRLDVDGNALLGRSGDARGLLTLLGGHALSIDGGLTVGEEGTDADGSGILVLDGRLTALGSMILGQGEGASGLISLFSGTSLHKTAAFATSIGFRGHGVLTSDAAFVSHAGPVFLGAFETGTGRIELENASSMLTTDSLFIGLRGVGEVLVASGSGLSTGPVVMGDREGSVGSARLTGAGSRWDVVGDLVVGDEGAAVLEVADQAFICLGGTSRVGSQGRVIIDATIRIELLTACAAIPREARHAAASGLLVSSLTVAEGGELVAEAIEIGDGGVVDGAGELTIPVTNGGTLAPGGDGALGTLALSASLTQTAAGTLSIEVGTSSTDALTVDGAATLGGTLRLVALSGEAPTVGQSYDVLTASSITGAFDQIEAPDGLAVSVSATAVTVTVASAVDAELGPVSSLSLLPPSPNPARGSVDLTFELADAGPVRLSVHDALGREVAVPLDDLRQPGAYEARLDASALAPGVYVVRLQAGNELAVQRLTVVR